MRNRKREKRRLNYLLLLFVLGAFTVFGISAGHPGPYPANGENLKEEAAVDNPVYLYFGEPEGRYLTGEPIAIKNAGDALIYGRRIIEALINGPTGGPSRGPSGALIPTLAEKTRLRSVFIDGPTVYVDFSGEISGAHPGGVRSELLTVYSIVNTLVLNMEQIDRVKILIEGNETETLAGHIAIANPLTAQMLLVR